MFRYIHTQFSFLMILFTRFFFLRNYICCVKRELVILYRAISAFVRHMSVNCFNTLNKDTQNNLCSLKIKLIILINVLNKYGILRYSAYHFTYYFKRKNNLTIYGLIKDSKLDKK